MRVAPAVVIDDSQRETLTRWSRSRTLSARQVERARVVLLAAEGRRTWKLPAACASATRRRRAGASASWAGFAGLEKDAPRPGRKPAIGARLTKRVVDPLTTRQQPANATHWSTRTMAAAVGISEASVRRIWRAHGLKPHRVETFKISNDPAFAEKLEDHRRPVSQSARTRAGAVRRREEPDSSPGSYPARPAAEARTRRDHDARLQTQRHRHAVRRAELRPTARSLACARSGIAIRNGSSSCA